MFIYKHSTLKNNKRPMGHIVLRKQFKSINTDDYIITGEKNTQYLLFEIWMVLYLNKLDSPSPKDALCQVWLKLAQWFWKRRFLNKLKAFSLFRNYLPLEMGMALHLNKFESPSPTRMLSLVEIGPVALEEKMKMCKVYHNIDKFPSKKLTRAFGTGELKINIFIYMFK